MAEEQPQQALGWGTPALVGAQGVPGEPHPLAAGLLTVGPPVCILQVAWEGGLVGKVVQGRVLDTASL